MSTARRPNSAKLRQTELVHRLRAPPRDPLRCDNTNVSRCIAPLPPGGATAPGTVPLLSMRPRFVLRNQVKVQSGAEDEAVSTVADDPGASTTSNARSFVVGGTSTTTSPRAAATAAIDTVSLRSLLAARRLVRNAHGVDYLGSSSVTFGTFPFRPQRSQYLALNGRLHTATTPLQLVLDVGSKETDEVGTMQALVQSLRTYMDQRAMSLERLVERTEAAIAEASLEDAPTDVDHRLARRLSSFCAPSTLSAATKADQEVIETMIGPPSSSLASAALRGQSIVAQVLRELYALIPRQLPDVVLCYWDFTRSDVLESEIAAAFGRIGMALTNAWRLVARYRHHLHPNDDDAAATAPSSGTPPVGDGGMRPQRCDVVWRMHHCKLRSNSMLELPLNAPQEDGILEADVHLMSDACPTDRGEGSGGAMSEAAPFARLRSSVNAYRSSLPPSMRLTSLSLCHCMLHETKHSGVQSVLRSSGWSLQAVELRGAHVTPELVSALSAVLQRPGGCLRRVVWANCTGWSTTDDSMQLALMEGVKLSRSLTDVTLQGVPLPATAGIALLGAVAHNAMLATVRLESCHYVTPKFLHTLAAALQNKDRGAQVRDRGRFRGRTMSTTTTSLEATMRSNCSE